MIYSELVKHTNEIIDGDLRVPFDLSLEKKIMECRWLDVRFLEIYKYRRWQARTMGFYDFSVEDMIELMYGQRFTRRWMSKEKSKFEWVFNHHTEKNERKRWIHSPEYFVRETRSGFWHWPPYATKQKWKCRICNLNELNREIPSTVMLKILRLQTIKLFNVFYVIEPVKPCIIPPVLLGTLWELPPITKEGQQQKVGYMTHFFVSEWC